MANITIGSTIIGASGKKLIVDRVEGDTIYSGNLKILVSAVVQVIPPTADTQFKLGDRVRFIGDYREWGVEYGTLLTVVELDDRPDSDEWIKIRTDEKKSIWVLISDLAGLEDDLWA